MQKFIKKIIIKKKKNFLILKTNFDYERIQSLYIQIYLALNLFELYELRKNYKKLNYSIIDVDLHF